MSNSPARRGERPPRLAVFLRGHKELLLQRWMRRVLDDPMVPEANRLAEPDLRDRIPALLERIIEAIARSSLEAMPGEELGRLLGNDAAAQVHASSRASHRYALSHALRELSHFRVAIIELCREHGIAFAGEQAQVVHALIDESMSTVAATMETLATEELREDAKLRERFIGILGHDLRTPLQSIGIAAGILQKRSDLLLDDSKTLSRIVQSVNRMERMVGDLLDLTRSRSGVGISIERTTCELDEICRHVVGELELIHPGRTIICQAEGDRRGAWDPGRIAQLLSNLLSNALDYSPDDAPVRIDVLGRRGYLQIEVRNEGEPISPELLPVLFDPYQRGVRDTVGLGLGLFIAKQIAEAHGGSIEAASALGRGTTFTVRLPRAG